MCDWFSINFDLGFCSFAPVSGCSRPAAKHDIRIDGEFGQPLSGNIWNIRFQDCINRLQKIFEASMGHDQTLMVVFVF
jgi:hypothetical protein